MWSLSIWAYAGITSATVGGLLLATQIPSDAVFYRDPESEQMVVDESHKAMQKYRKKRIYYRIGVALLVLGGALQFAAVYMQPAAING